MRCVTHISLNHYLVILVSLKPSDPLFKKILKGQKVNLSSGRWCRCGLITFHWQCECHILTQMLLNWTCGRVWHHFIQLSQAHCTSVKSQLTKQVFRAFKSSNPGEMKRLFFIIKASGVSAACLETSRLTNKDCSQNQHLVKTFTRPVNRNISKYMWGQRKFHVQRYYPLKHLFIYPCLCVWSWLQSWAFICLHS